MTTPFDPPGDADAEGDAASLQRWVLVLGTWGLSFAAIGTAVGGALQLTGWAPGSAASAGTGAMAAGALAGTLVLRGERVHALRRPELVGPGGGAARPLHGAVLAIPLLVVALPGLLCLAIVGTVSLGSLVPLLVFGMAAVGVVWAGMRVLSHHRLARALEALHVDGARTSPLETVAGTWWLAAKVRWAARVNLASIALHRGYPREALAWLDGRFDGSAAAWASIQRSLAHLLIGDEENAEQHLRSAMLSPCAGEIQAEADAVRVLLVWRTEGASAARGLAEQLGGPGASSLHCALQWALAGHLDTPGPARTEAVDAVLTSALGRAIPELASAPQLIGERARVRGGAALHDDEALAGGDEHERGRLSVHEDASDAAVADPERAP